MVHHCSVDGCTNRSSKPECRDIRFFRFTSVITHQGEQTRALSEERHQTWLERLNRENFTPTACSRVCSQHFVSGRPSSLYPKAQLDWAPTLKLGHPCIPRRQDLDRDIRLEGRNKEKRRVGSGTSIKMDDSEPTTKRHRFCIGRPRVSEEHKKEMRRKRNVKQNMNRLYLGASTNNRWKELKSSLKLSDQQLFYHLLDVHDEWCPCIKGDKCALAPEGSNLSEGANMHKEVSQSNDTECEDDVEPQCSSRSINTGTPPMQITLMGIGSVTNVNTPGIVGALPNVSTPGIVGGLPNVSTPGIVGALPNVGTPLIVGSLSNVSTQGIVGSLPNVSTPGIVGSLPNVSTQGIVGSLPNVSTQGIVGALPNVSTQGIVGALPNVSTQGIVGALPNVSTQGIVGALPNVSTQGIVGALPNVLNTPGIVFQTPQGLVCTPYNSLPIISTVPNGNTPGMVNRFPIFGPLSIVNPSLKANTPVTPLKKRSTRKAKTVPKPTSSPIANTAPKTGSSPIANTAPIAGSLPIANTAPKTGSSPIANIAPKMSSSPIANIMNIAPTISSLPIANAFIIKQEGNTLPIVITPSMVRSSSTVNTPSMVSTPSFVRSSSMVSTPSVVRSSSTVSTSSMVSTSPNVNTMTIKQEDGTLCTLQIVNTQSVVNPSPEVNTPPSVETLTIKQEPTD